MSKVVGVGGGAAGMMAAVAAAENGHTVTLLEKNEKLGKKVYITGKGRCNLTNNCEVEELLAAVCVNRKFLYSAFYGFTSQDTIDFFEQSGMHTKTERGNRVFPASDHASDVIAAFTATSRIEQLVQQPYNSLATALATFAAQNIGAGNPSRVRRGYRKSTLLVIVFSVIMCGIMFLAGEAFVRLFVKDANVIAIGGRAIRITSLFYIPLGMIYITRSLLNGAGDSAFAFVSGLAEVVGRVGFSILLAGIPALGYWAVWYTTGLTWFITGAVCVLRYLQGKWEKIVLVEK